MSRFSVLAEEHGGQGGWSDRGPRICWIPGYRMAPYPPPSPSSDPCHDSSGFCPSVLAVTMLRRAPGECCLVSLVVGIIEGAQIRSGLLGPQLSEASRLQRAVIDRG